MSDSSEGPGWWLASDGKWYPPQQSPAAAPQYSQQPPGDPQFRPVTEPQGRRSGVLYLVIGFFVLALIIGAVAVALFVGTGTEQTTDVDPVETADETDGSTTDSVSEEPTDDEPATPTPTEDAELLSGAEIQTCETEHASMQTAVAAADAANQASPGGGDTPLDYLLNTFDNSYWIFGEGFSIVPIDGQSGACGDFLPTELSPEERRAECESQLDAFKTAVGAAMAANSSGGATDATPGDYLNTEEAADLYWEIDDSWTVVPITGGPDPC